MEKRIQVWLFATAAFLCCSVSSSQPLSRYNTFSYNVNEGLLQSTLNDIAFDKNNFCWLAFPNGIQRFDGNNFITVPAQPGLPDDKLCRFFQCGNGELLVSHSMGVSKYDIAGNRFSQIYTLEKDNKTPPLFLGGYNGIIYLYTEQAVVIGLNNTNYTVVSKIKSNLPAYDYDAGNLPYVGTGIFNNKKALRIGQKIYLLDLITGKTVFRSAEIPAIGRFFLAMKNESEIYYSTYSRTNFFHLLNTFSNKSTTLLTQVSGEKQLSRADLYKWGNKTLLSLNDRIYETDSALQTIKAEIVNFQNQPVSAGGQLVKIREDNFGNLLLQTIQNGIRKIIRSNYPVKHYSSAEAGKNHILSILPDKENNRILIGAANNGVLVFDTLQRLIRHIRISSSDGQLLSPNTIIKKPDGNYLVLAIGENILWQISSDLSVSKAVPITRPAIAGKTGISYFCHSLYQSDELAIIQSGEYLYKINLGSNKAEEHFIAPGYFMSGLYIPPYIITHANDELFFLDATSFMPVKKIAFKNTANVRCFTTDNAGNIYAGTNKGIFKINLAGEVLRHFSRQDGLPDECIYAMSFDANGFLWCSTNKGLLKVKDNRVLLQLRKEDGLQENEFNTNVMALAQDGELFFGGVNGVSSFYPSAISNHEDSLNLFFTSIRANGEEAVTNTAAWEVSSIQLPYDRSALSFDFIAMGNNNPDQYVYQYRMDGVDNEWIQQTSLQTIRYNLPPGKYTFNVYASRSFDKNAAPLKMIRIIIRPPFWKSWWFITLSALAFIGLLIYLINQRNKKKYEQKLQLLENERQLKEERERISKDLHDSLGAYANAVLYNTELLEKEKDAAKQEEIIGGLKFASKDIITSLRETVWALKKENYSAEDCLVRIRNFIQPLSRYYSHINFVMEGDAPGEISFHYTKALALVRIVQESTANSIKHAAAKNILISSKVNADEKWHIMVQDDGKGFNFSAIRAVSEGNGLNNMQQRAAAAGFYYDIETEEGKGTTINLII